MDINPFEKLSVTIEQMHFMQVFMLFCLFEKSNFIAVNAARAVGAKICGADIIIQDIQQAPNEKNHSIIELNFNPALHIHDFPFKGQNRHAEQKVLDLLF